MPKGESLFGPERRLDPEVDKVINEADLLKISAAIGSVKGNKNNASQIEKVGLFLEVLKHRGFASPHEVLSLNADLAQLGLEIRLTI